MERVESPLDLRVDRWAGVVMLVGDTDSGKSSLARRMWPAIVSSHRRPAFLDADMGQGIIGPPTAQSLALFSPAHPDSFPPRGKRVRYFVGSITPRKHMLDTLVGLSLLVREALSRSDLILVDTTGFVSPKQGGIYLKGAKMEILRPSLVVILEREREISTMLEPWEALGISMVSLPVSPDVRVRSLEERRERRRFRLRRYFRNSRRFHLKAGIPAIGHGNLEAGRLLGLLDHEGFLLSLAVCEDSGETITVSSPLKENLLDAVSAIRLSDLWLDPRTGEHGRYIPPEAAETRSRCHEQ